MIDAIVFDKTPVFTQGISQKNAIDLIKSKKKVWLDLSSGNKEYLENILSTIFPEYYRLVLEDCLEDSKPKIEEYPNAVFCVFKTYPPRAKNYGQMSLIITKNILITYHNNSTELKKVKEYFSKFGAKSVDFIFYKVLDHLISGYYREIEEYDDAIDALEKNAIDHTNPKTMTDVMDIKSELLDLHRILVAERDILLEITRDEENNGIIKEHTRIYLRDIYDDIMRLIDREEMYKERLSGAMQLYLALSSYEVNEVMKRLTVLASYIMIPMLVTGIYGMNFKFMPELSSPYGYPFAFFLMFVGVLFAHGYFKKKLLL